VRRDVAARCDVTLKANERFRVGESLRSTQGWAPSGDTETTRLDDLVVRAESFGDDPPLGDGLTQMPLSRRRSKLTARLRRRTERPTARF
jgi:hypothetical protein